MECALEASPSGQANFTLPLGLTSVILPLASPDTVLSRLTNEEGKLRWSAGISEDDAAQLRFKTQ